MISLNTVRRYTRIDGESAKDYYLLYDRAVWKFVSASYYNGRYVVRQVNSSSSRNNLDLDQYNIDSFISSGMIFTFNNPDDEEIDFSHVRYCHNCSKVTYSSQPLHRHGRHDYCNGCFMAISVECNDCGNRVHQNTAVVVTINSVAKRVCNSCLSENYDTCNGCGSVHVKSEIKYLNNTPSCHDCADDFSVCDECNHYYRFDQISDDVDGCICQTCSESIRSANMKRVQAWNYKPSPVFYGDSQTNRFYGVELEIGGGGESDATSTILQKCINTSNEYIYIKHDGSIANGFEIVSHPATLDVHLDTINWHGFTSQAVALGYTGHDNGTCGLHVHVSRLAFGDSSHVQKENTGKLVYFFEKFKPYIIRFARRTNHSMERYAKFLPLSFRDVECRSLVGLYDYTAEYMDRYSAINVQNENTVEIRIFRSTLNYNSFVATLQFVDLMVDIATSMSFEDIKNLTWDMFVNSLCKDKKELYRYMAKRNLVSSRSFSVA